MESIHIEFQPNVKEKLLEFLNSFSKNELKIVEEENSFEATKSLLHQRLKDLKEGKVNLISIEDYEKSLDQD
ncbi:hypothetical protein OX283_008150 [Flavobacterium sp. SUN052]|uniref:hypothetical protein n=1 Tax=Flavobacterium sp. SUN052 TaxID=3002441 RepID=UPI00237DF545|nr:hypothetical protein [Flavobacterium sp. SUN052]MEC4004624.1 hypothetical protein [Flavobacterium sp. SUN052]